jgi:three-Cys-motif partner protein
MKESVVGRWAADKLDRLKKIVGAYTTIMHKQQWCAGYDYIDAFAGPGEHEVRRAESADRPDARQALIDVASFGSEREDQKQFLAGSPRVALDLEHPFSSYVFVERSPERVAALERLQAEYGTSRKILVQKADCTQYLCDKVANNPQLDWSKHRAFVFLDPFGMQVSWDAIEQLANTKGIEIFLNFPVGMAIQRLLRRQPENFTKTQRDRLDDYFGSAEWMNVLYRPRRTLFGDEDQEKIERSGAVLMKWYRDRLRTIFSHVSKAALIRNSQGGHLYYLLLASHNKTGVKIANDVLTAGEVI